MRGVPALFEPSFRAVSGIREETGELEQTLSAYTFHRCIAWLAPCCLYFRAPRDGAARQAIRHAMTGRSPVPVMFVFISI